MDYHGLPAPRTTAPLSPFFPGAQPLPVAAAYCRRRSPDSAAPRCLRGKRIDSGILGIAA